MSTLGRWVRDFRENMWICDRWDIIKMFFYRKTSRHVLSRAKPRKSKEQKSKGQEGTSLMKSSKNSVLLLKYKSRRLEIA